MIQHIHSQRPMSEANPGAGKSSEQRQRTAENAVCGRTQEVYDMDDATFSRLIVGGIPEGGGAFLIEKPRHLIHLLNIVPGMHYWRLTILGWWYFG